jgi:hypothetical protein
MSAAEKIAPMTTELLAWGEICKRHPNEWVFLSEVQHEPDGSIRSARLLVHHRSMKEALDQCSWSADPEVVYAHTWGRELRFPRIEMTDEIRDIIRARR